MVPGVKRQLCTDFKVARSKTGWPLDEKSRSSATLPENINKGLKEDNTLKTPPSGLAWVSGGRLIW